MKKLFKIFCVVSFIWIFSGCGPLFTIENDHKNLNNNKVEKVGFNNSVDLNVKFNTLFEEFKEFEYKCNEDIDLPKPKPIFLTKNFKETTPEKSKIIGYRLEDNKKIAIKIIVLNECVENYKLIADKYNLLLDYIETYKLSVDLDSEFKEGILNIQEERIKFFNEQINEYEILLEKEERKRFWDGLFNKLIMLGVIIAAII